MPPRPFAITRDGELIQHLPIRSTVRTGIDFDDPRVELGLVAEFEEREAAVFCGTPWLEWNELDTRERAAGVAHYRIHYLIQLHTTDAVHRDQDRKMKKANSNGA